MLHGEPSQQTDSSLSYAMRPCCEQLLVADRAPVVQCDKSDQKKERERTLHRGRCTRFCCSGPHYCTAVLMLLGCRPLTSKNAAQPLPCHGPKTARTPHLFFTKQ